MIRSDRVHRSRLDSLSVRHRVVFSTVSQSVATVLTAGISILVLHLTTESLGPSRYGYLTTAVAFISIFSLIADLGLTSITSRDMARHPERTSEILSVNLSLRLVLSVLATPILTTVAYFLYPAHRSSVGLGVLVLSADVLLNAVSNTMLTYYASRTRNDVIALVILTSKITYLLTVIIATLLGTGLLGYIVAYLVGDSVGLVIALFSVLRRGNVRLTFVRRGWLATIRRSFPLGIMQIIGILYIWTGTICLSLFRSSSDVAYYGVCTGFIVMSATISGYFMGALIPTLATATKDYVDRIIQDSWDLMAFAGALVCLEAVILRRPLVVLIAGSKFASAAQPLGILGGVAFLMYLNNVIGYSSVALDRYRSLALVQTPSLVMQITLNLLLVPHLGVTGAALAILLSELCSLIGSLLVFSRHTTITVLSIRRLKLVPIAIVVFLSAGLAKPLWETTSPLTNVAVGSILVALVYLDLGFVFRALPREVEGYFDRHLAIQGPSRFHSRGK